MAWPALFDPIVNAPRGQKIAIGIMGLVGLVGAGYFFVISPLEIRVNTARAQHAALQRELDEARAAVADLARARREAAEFEMKLETMRERLPTEKEMPPLFRTLTDVAFQSGLQVSLFQPREGRVRDYYVEVPIAVTADGGYHQLGEFFARVAGLTRVVTVDELKVTGLGRPKTPVRAELTLATYQYRPVGSPPAPKPAQPGAQR